MAAPALALALLLAAAPDPNGVEAALGRPLSPGAVALLLQHAVDPRAGARLIEALSHERADVRAAAARVAGSVGLRAGLPALAQAVARESDAVAGLEEVRALALLAESTEPGLLRAVAGVGPAALDTWASTRAQAHPDRLLEELPVLREAGLGEQQVVGALASAADRDPGIAARVRERALGAGDAGQGAPALDRLPTLAALQGSERSLRLAAPLPPGYAADTLAVAGCKLDGKMAGGRVLYRADGRAKDVRLFRDLGVSPACLAATAALLASLHEGARPAAREGEIVLLPLEADVVSCDQREPPQPRGSAQNPRTVGFGIEEPRKIHHVNPAFPRAAASAGVGGVVVLEAVITPAGCVGSLELLQGAQRLLEIEALRAVSRWRYTPTLLNGQPVPVVMTVTVNFKVTTAPAIVIRH